MLQPFNVQPNKTVGAEKITSWFGGWPTFHDAEVLNLSLDRNGSVLTASVFTFLVDRSTTDERGYYRRTHNCIVTLSCRDIHDLSITDFNQQNVLRELIIREDDDVEVIFAGIYGLSARLRCSVVVVDNLAPVESEENSGANGQVSRTEQSGTV